VVQSRVEDLSPVVKKVSVEVTPDRVKDALDSAFTSVSRTVKLKGYRQGHVPRLRPDRAVGGGPRLRPGARRRSALSGVRPDDLAIWLTDPTRAPHGGESVVELIERVRGWMDSLTTRRTRLVAVTHPSVIRAAILVALSAPPKSFWRIDIAPVSRTVMHFRGHAWTLRSDR